MDTSTWEGFPARLSTKCPDCERPVPINGIAPAILCSSCGRRLELGKEAWDTLMDRETLAEVLTFAEGEGRQMSVMGGFSAKISLGRRKPRCQKCQQDVALARLPEYAAAGGLTCGCGERIRVREATDLAKAHVPGAIFLVNEEGVEGTDGQDALLQLKKASEPVLLACMACGASLAVDGSQRMVTCRFCNASNYLPDGLWLRLHPVPTLRTFFVVADLSRPNRAALMSGSPDAAKFLAKEPDIPPDIVEKLADSEDYEVRASLAGNPSAPPAVLRRLATDDDSDVRRSLAGNPALPDEAFAQLAADGDYGVRAALAGNPATPARFLAKIAEKEEDSDVLDAFRARAELPLEVLTALAGNSEDYRAPLAAARNRSAPRDLLKKLARHDHDEVSQAAKERLKALPPEPRSLVKTILWVLAGLAFLAALGVAALAALLVMYRDKLGF